MLTEFRIDFCRRQKTWPKHRQEISFQHKRGSLLLKTFNGEELQRLSCKYFLIYAYFNPLGTTEVMSVFIIYIFKKLSVRASILYISHHDL